MRGRKPKWPPEIHTRRGRDYLRLATGEVTLGPTGSAEARQEYARILAEGEARPRRDGITVAEAVDAYTEARPQAGGNYYAARKALRVLIAIYGHTQLEDFGPVALKAIRKKLLEDVSLSRHYVNALVRHLRTWVRWCVAEELCPATRLVALKAVDGLMPGEGGVERPGREPVDQAVVLASLEHLPWPVPDMVRLQLATGMRPGEVCRMRPCDVVRPWKVIEGVPLWLYSLGRHKTARLGHLRDVPLGPAEQRILTPYLDRPEEWCCFCPAETRRWRYEQRLGKREWPASARDGIGYATNWYDAVIREALAAAGLETWTPHQIRHAVGTEAATDGEIEDAQALLGHEGLSTTAIYAKRLLRAARLAARRV